MLSAQAILTVSEVKIQFLKLSNGLSKQIETTFYPLLAKIFFSNPQSLIALCVIKICLKNDMLKNFSHEINKFSYFVSKLARHLSEHWLM